MKKYFLMLASAMVTTMASFAATTPEPVITIEPVGNHNVFTPGNYYQEICVFDYKVTATGEGDVHLLLNGEEVSNPFTFPLDHNYGYWQDDTWYENEVDYCFIASVKVDEGVWIETSQTYTVNGIPRYSLTYDEETESYWISFPYGTRYRNWGTGNEWEQYSQPFKVWQAPQSLYGGVHIEVMADGNINHGYLPSNMGILHDLSLHIAGSRFRYCVYEDGVYYPYEYMYPELPETPIVPLYNYICNKYWEPSEHPSCYSGEVVVPNHVEGILDHTFENCPDLSSVFLPASVTTIGEQAFVGCNGLESVEIESLEAWCETLFADSLSNPLYYADHLYWNGEEIRKLEIENEYGVYFNPYSFAGFKGLVSVTCMSMEPPYAANDAFYKLYDQVTIFVPDGAVENYRSHEEWGRFSRIVPFIGAGPGDTNGDGVINIADVTGLIDQLLYAEELPAYIDVNGDGMVNITDVTTLIDQLLGLN